MPFRLLVLQALFRWLAVGLAGSAALALTVEWAGVDHLPRLYLVAAGLLVALGLFDRWPMSRMPVGATVGLQLLITTVVPAGLWWYLTRSADAVGGFGSEIDGDGPNWAPLVALAAVVVPALLSSRALELQAGLLYDRRAIARLGPRIDGLSMIGVLLAGLAVPILVLVVDLVNALLAAAVAALAVMVAGIRLVLNYASRFAARPDAASRSETETILDPVTSGPVRAVGWSELADDHGCRLVLTNRFLQQLTRLVLLFVLLEVLFDRFDADGPAIATALVLVGGAGLLVGTGLGLAAGQQMLLRFGLRNVQTMPPVILVAAASAVLVFSLLDRLSTEDRFWAVLLLVVVGEAMFALVVDRTNRIALQAMPEGLRARAGRLQGGLVVALGTATAAAILFVLSATGAIGGDSPLVVVAVASALWVVTAWRTGAWYRGMVQRRAGTPALGPVEIPVDTREAAAVALRLARADEPTEVIRGLDLYAELGGEPYHQQLLRLASLVEEESILVPVIERIGQERVSGARSVLEAEATEGPTPRIRSAAMASLVLCEPHAGGAVVEGFLQDPRHQIRAGAVEALLGGAALRQHDVALAELTELAVSPFVDERAAAAAIIGRTAPSGHRDLITPLLHDPDDHVKTLALGAVGALGLAGHTPTVVSALADPATRRPAAMALAALGNSAVPDITELLTRPDLGPEPAVLLLEALSVRPSPAGTAVVARHVDHENGAVRAAAIDGLVGNPHLDSPRLPSDVKINRLLPPVIDQESTRAADLYEAIGAIPEGPEYELLERAVRQQADVHASNVFRLMAVRHRNPTLAGLAVPTPTDGLAAAEAEALVDSVPSDSHRQLVATLVRLATRSRPGRHGPAGELAMVLAASDDDWTAAAAVHGAALADRSVEDILRPAKVIGPIQAATLSWSRRRIIAGGLKRRTGQDRQTVENYTVERYTAEGYKAMALTEQVEFLRRCAIFEEVPDRLLVEVAQISRRHTVRPDGTIQQADHPVSHLDVIVNGEVGMMADETTSVVMTTGDIIGQFGVLHAQVAPVEVRALTEVELLRIDGRDLRRLLEQRPALSVAMIRSLAVLAEERPPTTAEPTVAEVPVFDGDDKEPEPADQLSLESDRS